MGRRHSTDLHSWLASVASVLLRICEGNILGKSQISVVVSSWNPRTRPGSDPRTWSRISRVPRSPGVGPGRGPQLVQDVVRNLQYQTRPTNRLRSLLLRGGYTGRFHCVFGFALNQLLVRSHFVSRSFAVRLQPPFCNVGADEQRH